MWSTHQFWVGLLEALGVNPRKIVFSSDTSEEQSRNFAKGRGTVDCCYPVKCISGHYGELLARDKHRKIDVLFSPMIYSLPSFMQGHVLDTLACPRVMAAPENIKAGFLKEKDAFGEREVRYVAPLVALGDPPLVPKQLHPALKAIFPELTFAETQAAVRKGFDALGLPADAASPARTMVREFPVSRRTSPPKGASGASCVKWAVTHLTNSQ